MATPEKKDIKVTASDALEFEPVAPRPPKKRWGLRSFLLLMVAGGSAWGWQNYGEGIMTLWGGTDGGIPLVRAAPGPVKVRPENPGGLRVPDRDKLVYDLIQGKNGGQKVARGPERLLPPPEQPLPKPGTMTGAKTAAQTESGPQAGAPAMPEKVLPKAKPAKKKPTPKTKPMAKVPTVKDVATAKRPVPPPPPAAPSKATSPRFSLAKRTPPKEEDKPPAPAKQAPTVQTAPTVKPKTPVPESTAAPPAPASTETARATPAPGPKPIPRGRAYLVQLAAARSREGAEGEWNRLRARNLDLLGDLRLTVTKADLGPEKGVFYRLRAGPLADEPSARRLCSRLSIRQVGCLIIKPGQ